MEDQTVAFVLIVFVLFAIFVGGLALTPKDTILEGVAVGQNGQFPFDDFYCEGFMYTIYNQNHEVKCAHNWSYQKMTWLNLAVIEDDVLVWYTWRQLGGPARIPRSEVKAITYKDGSVFLPSREGN